MVRAYLLSVVSNHFYITIEKNQNAGGLHFEFTINMIEMKNSVY